MATAMDDDHLAAEIAKLKAETRLIAAQTRKLKAENDQQLQIEIRKSMAETDKIRAETRWYPWVAVGLAALGILATAAVGIFKVIHG